MVKSAWNSARDADEIFFLVDADKVEPHEPRRFWQRKLPNTWVMVVIVDNCQDDRYKEGDAD